MTPPVVWLTAAYGAGLWTGLVFLLPAATLWAVGMGGGALAVRRGFAGPLLLAAALGGVTGAQRAAQRAASCRERWSPASRAATVMVHDAAGPRRVTRATVVSDPTGCVGQVMLRLPRHSPPAGSRVVAVGVSRAHGILQADHVRVLDAPRAWRFALRERIARRLRVLYGERAGLLEALVLGRRDDLEPALRAVFAEAGLAHLLAISGLHVGIVAAWVVALASLVVPRRPAWIASAAVTWGYVALLGFPPPATRAAGFVTLHAAARLVQRHPPGAAVLAVAVLLVLLIEPDAVSAVGAWLSVAAVWGTGVAGRALPARLRRVAPARLAAASLGATLATAPITALAFGAVAPIAVPANLVAVPLAGLVVPGVMASLVGGQVLAGGAGLALAALEQVARAAAAVPYGHLSGPAGAAFAAPWAAAVVGALWLIRRRPRWAVLRLRMLTLVAAACWILAGLDLGRGPGRRRDLALHFLDVGQGDAIAIRTPRGRWLLVDGGPLGRGGDAGRRVVLPFLRRMRAERLAAVVLSHGDADHLGGIPAVLAGVRVGRVLEPGQPLGTGLYLEYLAAVSDGGTPWQPARAGDTLVLDSVVIAVLHPSARWLERQVVPNENSVVLKLSYGCFEAVLSGDIGRPAEAELLGTVGAADLLKVGHHGSAGSTTPEWLVAVNPKAAVISVGPNGYGHPAPAVMDRLARRGVPVWRTDRGGTVTVRTNGRYFTVGQGERTSVWEGLRCRMDHWLRSSASSSSRSGCTPRLPVSLPSCSTTSP